MEIDMKDDWNGFINGGGGGCIDSWEG